MSTNPGSKATRESFSAEQGITRRPSGVSWGGKDDCRVSVESKELCERIGSRDVNAATRERKVRRSRYTRGKPFFRATGVLGKSKRHRGFPTSVLLVRNESNLRRPSLSLPSRRRIVCSCACVNKGRRTYIWDIRVFFLRSHPPPRVPAPAPHHIFDAPSTVFFCSRQLVSRKVPAS